jgi:hypothetical protein
VIMGRSKIIWGKSLCLPRIDPVMWSFDSIVETHLGSSRSSGGETLQGGQDRIWTRWNGAFDIQLEIA